MAPFFVVDSAKWRARQNPTKTIHPSDDNDNVHGIGDEVDDGVGEDGDDDGDDGVGDDGNDDGDDYDDEYNDGYDIGGHGVKTPQPITWLTRK